jgi:D-alanine-D-alanine ligase
MKIVVLAGGISTERNVSFSSGTKICSALRARGHKAIMIDMFMGLEDYDGPVDETIFDAEGGFCSEARISTVAPDLDAVRASRKLRSPSVIGKDVLGVCAMADIVFLALHGACGEDGRIQAAFDLLGIPYTGAGYLSSAMAMDKAMTKRMMEAAGVRTAPWRDIKYSAGDIGRIVSETELPCVVKTINGGSSIGVYITETKDELEDALRGALKHGSHIIIEKKITGRELTCGVLGDEYLPAVEIRPKAGGYDYANKYQAGATEEICPAPITAEQQKDMGEATLRLYRMLGLSVYSRADFLLDENGDAWCLEINTLPGMTPTSLIPQEAAAVGIGYEDLCEKIIELSFKARSEK